MAMSASSQEIDVQHYRFYIALSDATDSVKGTTAVLLNFVQPASSFSLDLVQAKDNKKGMSVTQLTGDHVKSWRQENDKILVALDTQLMPGEMHTYQITYSGIPADGLIISKNKWGDRTFFADNWPNRAHHWIPCNDRPDDKASFEFIVDAPPGYAIISNGGMTPVEEGGPIQPPNRRPLRHSAHWVAHVPLSTKVMVIGVAKFAIKYFSDSPPDIPVSAWVYPQDSTKGFYDYGITPSILKFFSDYIGPYPYEKLANVQSKTIFGGMENASAIFYAEESVTGNRKWEDVFAHEIVHQWFGDMASEKSFAHLWLSEGFATYLTNMYVEKKYGSDSMHHRLFDDRLTVINFKEAGSRPVVDTTTDLMSLLNANSYQKGGWVLHMLRQELGNEKFQQVIRAYYEAYKGRNADTRDFVAVVNRVGGRDLTWFFDQWLYLPGMPSLEFVEKIKKDSVRITIRQTQSNLYKIPIEVGLLSGDDQMNVFRINLSKAETIVVLPTGGKKVEILYDPDVNLLFRLHIQGSRPGTYWRRVKVNRRTGERIYLN
jgi:aminopeptidase N